MNANDPPIARKDGQPDEWTATWQRAFGAWTDQRQADLVAFSVVVEDGS